jgi:hypothetical protein
MYTITGSDGGSWPDLSSSLQSQITQSWTGYYSSYSGSIPFTRDDLSDFFTGELSGSNFVVSTQSLNSNNNYITQSNPDITLFELSPYNVLVNNVSSSTLSSFFMDVDYSNGAVLPINQQLLLSGSAFKFEIPDSNYTAYRNVALRYNGSKTTSPNFNKPIYNRSSDAFINNQYSIVSPSTQSQEPNASRYSNYFIYFDYIETAFPEVPNGGNVHAVYVITTEGKAIPLTGDNAYVNEISNIFVSGTLAVILPAVYAAGTKNPQVTVFDGGAKYQTICTLSGSGYVAGAWGQLYVGGNTNSTYLTTGSNKGELYDNVDTTNEVVPLQESYNEWMRDGVLQSNQELFTYLPFGDFGVYSKKTETVIFNTNPNNNVSIDGINTYFPIQYGDFIRFGDRRSVVSTSGSLASGSVDYSFYSLGLYNILTSLREPAPANPSTLFLTPSLMSSITSSILGGANKGNPTSNTVFVNQNWRIFRRVPNETNIVLSKFPSFRDPGFLIPENFNPAYNPYDLAKKAGIIT